MIRWNFATPVFGIKAKLIDRFAMPRALILPPPFLESRQSKAAVQMTDVQFCHPRFWNQGKA